MSTKEIRTDLYTQSAYAEKIKKSKAWVNRLIKEGKLTTVSVNGGILIKA